jgi:hypothetical protein
MTGSWKTTTYGVIAIVVAILGAVQAMLDGNPATNPNWETTIAAIMAGMGLINARDKKVTSEQQGLK